MERSIEHIDLNRNYETFKELSLTCFGPGANVDKAMHQWFLNDNPYNPDGNLLFLLKEGDKAIACDGLIPGELYLHGKTLRMAHSVKTMTHPDYQRQGIFRMMTENSVEAGRKAGIDVILGLANAASYPGYQKFGWLSLFKREVLVQPICLRGYLQRKIKSVALARLGSKVYGQILRQRCKQKDSSLRFEWLQQVPPEIQSCWERYKDLYEILLVRDFKYLNYRYNQRPDVAYQTLIARRGQEIVGFAILREGHTSHSVMGNVCEFFTDPFNEQYIAELSRAISRVALKKNWDYLVLSCGLYGLYLKVLKANGYRPTPTPPPNDQMIALILSENVSPEEITGADSWYCSQGEGDIELDLR